MMMMITMLGIEETTHYYSRFGRHTIRSRIRLQLINFVLIILMMMMTMILMIFLMILVMMMMMMNHLEGTGASWLVHGEFTRGLFSSIGHW